ncbi:UPF0149 family protein [Wenzhouxiangella sp. XN79A]|uniref:UPF0149 family protein n=1 Tax=Wenzhouxiangella sp. XN79A TaxID=2724193 RepID=UPI00144A5FF0|nr:UPF0149 family protein [Wenzhouxiangella sp. XN79A]NKI36058.1 UPF0149 family protein [Wenzhouxiangella sp. XN79A]
MNDNESKLAWLLALAADSDPARVAETHGVVIGLLVAAPGQDDQRLADQLAGLQVGDWNSDRIQQQLGPAIATLRSELASPDMDFRPLLPTDDRPLDERTHCLAAWVTGFLAGYGTAGRGAEQGDAAEALRMLEQIARAGLDPEADDEIQEEALTELNEFVRVATLLLREERLRQSA